MISSNWIYISKEHIIYRWKFSRVTEGPPKEFYLCIGFNRSYSVLKSVSKRCQWINCETVKNKGKEIRFVNMTWVFVKKKDSCAYAIVKLHRHKPASWSTSRTSRIYLRFVGSGGDTTEYSGHKSELVCRLESFELMAIRLDFKRRKDERRKRACSCTNHHHTTV